MVKVSCSDKCKRANDGRAYSHILDCPTMQVPFHFLLDWEEQKCGWCGKQPLDEDDYEKNFHDAGDAHETHIACRECIK